MRMKNDLQKMKLLELLVIAKELNISGRHDMRKSQLVDKIIDADNMNTIEESSLIDESKGNRSSYVDNIRIGVLIAFRVNDRKALSGKVEEIHGEGFVVSTKNGIRFNVRKKNVMWVKTGDRWPKGVYLALKGENALVEHQEAN